MKNTVSRKACSFNFIFSSKNNQRKRGRIYYLPYEVASIYLPTGGIIIHNNLAEAVNIKIESQK